MTDVARTDIHVQLPDPAHFILVLFVAEKLCQRLLGLGGGWKRRGNHLRPVRPLVRRPRLASPNRPPNSHDQFRNQRQPDTRRGNDSTPPGCNEIASATGMICRAHEIGLVGVRVLV